MTTCSVIIVSYYTGPVLFASLKTVLKQQQLAEIILVDNGNPPAIAARLQQMTLTEPRLHIITGQGNIGYAKGANLGAKQAIGDFVLFLNPDCLLPPDALIDTMAALNETPGAIVAGCMLLNPDGSEQRGGHVPLLTLKTLLLNMVGLSKDTPLLPQTHEVPAVSSACMALKNAHFKKLNGFDEAFFLYLEDMDLCKCVQLNGGKIIYVPRVKVTHMQETTHAVSSRFVEWHKTKAVMYYFKKYFSKKYVSPKALLANLAVLLRFGCRAVVGNISGRIKEPLLTQSVPAKRLMVLASGYAHLPETKELYGKTVLVTGATSQVGLCVVHRVLAAGGAVLAMSRTEPGVPFAHENLRWIKADLDDKSCNLQGYYVDIVVHCAPLWFLPSAIDMLHGAEAKRIVAFGSTSIFAKALSRNAHEKNLVEKLRIAEQDLAARCDEKKIGWTIFRPTLIYGVGLDMNVTSLAKFINRFSFFPVYPPASGRRQPVHADDLAIAALQAIANPVSLSKSYNLSGGEILTYREMLVRLFTLLRKKTRIIESTFLPFILDVAGVILQKKHINGEIARRMNDDLIFFHDEAKKDIGFSPRAFLSGGIRDIEGF